MPSQAKNIMENNKMVKKLEKFYRENPEDFSDDFEALDDAYAGNYLVWNRCYPMSKLNDVLDNMSPRNVMKMCSYSSDEDGDNFNPDRAYFCFTCTGGLYSTNDRSYTGYLDDCIVSEIIDKAPRSYLSEGAQKIINGQA